MSELTDFLLARISEDEEDICHCCDQGLGSRMGFARAECEAKRQAIRLLGTIGGHYEPNAGRVAHEIKCAMALPYAEHPEFQDEWRP